jgi:hypothetical protein
MKIDTSTGTITFSLGNISRLLNKAQFLDSPIGRLAKKSLVNANWSHFEIDPEEGIAGTLLFDGDSIDRIFLSMRMKSEESKEWSVEYELLRKAKHEEWLQEAMGAPPYKYHWGRVVSEFDPKGLASDIIIVYDR